MKNSNDTIGNRIRHLLACNAVPQPTAPPRAPYLVIQILDLFHVKNKEIKYFNRTLHYIFHLIPTNLQCSTMQHIHSNLTANLEFYVTRDPQKVWFILTH